VTDALTIGWTRAQAATARTAYRRLLAFNLIVQTTVGPIALFAPVWLARQADLPSPLASGWVQLWGVMLLITASLYLPGCIEPVHVRWPNVIGIIARFVLARATPPDSAGHAGATANLKLTFHVDHSAGG
jgi:hypothetical protein